MHKNRLLRYLRRRPVFGGEVSSISRVEMQDKRKNARTRIAEVTPRTGLAETA